MKTLNESGLQRNDLDYLIMPMLDIDTYESKIDNAKAVVVAFYVMEHDPAKDLERFIEKSNIEILDAETSPAPTEDGYYVVFVELDRDDELPEKITDIIEQVDNLTNVDKWQFKTIDNNEIHDLSEESIGRHVNLDPNTVPIAADDAEDELAHDQEEEQEPEAGEAEEEPEAGEAEEGNAEEEEPATVSIEESVSLILKNGLMESAEIDGDILYLTSPGSMLRYRITHVSDSEPSIPVIGFEIGNPLIRESTLLGKILGQSYHVEAIDGGLLVGCDQGYMILETID